MAKIGSKQEVKLADLQPYERNARTHSEEQVEQIAASIKEFGFISPVLIDEENNVLAGHGRIMAAEKLGMKSVPCLRVEGLTEEQKKAYILVDNKLTELGGWNFELLDSELIDLDGIIDMSLFGFDDIDGVPADIDGLFEDADPKEPEKPKTITCPYCGETFEV